MNQLGLKVEHNIQRPKNGWTPIYGEVSTCTTLVTQSLTLLGYKNMDRFKKVLFDLGEPYVQSFETEQLRIWVRPEVLEAFESYVKIGGYADLTATEYVKSMLG